MQLKRLTRHEVEAARKLIAGKQRYICPICKGQLSRVKGDQKKTGALDHCHTTGLVRGILCINCNGLEGKIKGLAQISSRALSLPLLSKKVKRTRQERRYHKNSRIQEPRNQYPLRV